MYSPVSIKDLSGKVLYTDDKAPYGYVKPFQAVLEQAVREGVELPNADLRNKEFKGLQIPNAKIPGASFENSTFEAEFKSHGRNPVIHSDISNGDLRNVSFKGATINIADRMNVKGSDVDGANLEGQENLRKLDGFLGLKNLDKASGVAKEDLKAWNQAQEVKNSRATLDVSKLMGNQGR